MAESASEFRRVDAPTWMPWALFALAIAVHAISWFGDFVYDDVVIIGQDERIRDPSLWHRLWTRTYWGYGWESNLSSWRPITSSTFALNAWTLGLRPWSFHVINTLLHGAVTLAVFSMGRQLLRGWQPALAAAALFAVHPLHSEAVASVVGRSELMATLFALLAWSAHRRGHAALSGVWLALGLLSKESALPILGVMALDDLLGRPGRDEGRPDRQILVRSWTAPASVAVIYLALRASVVGSFVAGAGMHRIVHLNPFLLPDADVVGRVATALRLLGYQWWLFVWPARLLADHGIHETELSSSLLEPRVMGAACIVATLVAVAVTLRRRRPEVTLAIGLWAFPVLLLSNLLFPIGVLLAERLLYLPSVGMCLLAGALLGPALTSGRRAHRLGGWLLLGLLLVALGGRAAHRSWLWGTDLRLWQHDVGVAPRSSQLWSNLGKEMNSRGRLQEAHDALTRAVELSRVSPGSPPIHGPALRSLVGVHMALAAEAADEGDAGGVRHHHAAAERAIDQYHDLNLRDPDVQSYLGILLFTRGEVDRAEEVFSEISGGRNLIALSNCAEFYLRTDRPERALEALTRALERHPDAALVHRMLARTHDALGHEETAERHRQEAERLLGGGP